MSILFLMVSACIALQIGEQIERVAERARQQRPSVHRVRRYRMD